MSSQTSQTLAHEMVAESLRHLIRSGSWSAEQMIPSRRKLASEHGVALATIEKAVCTLIFEGYLRADGRRGTFVTGSERNLNNLSRKSLSRSVSAPPLTGTVGIIAPVVAYKALEKYEGQWPLRILQACEHRLSAETGLTLHFLSAFVRSSPKLEITQMVRQMVADKVDVVILLHCEPNAEALACLQEARIPVIIANLNPIASSLPQVYIDSAAGARNAACHLIDRGYRKLLYFQPFKCDWSDLRLTGAREGIVSMGLPPQTLEVSPVNPLSLDETNNNQDELARDSTRELFADGFVSGTGVIAPNDAAAQEFISVASEYGLVAGRDYGIVGFDDRNRDLGLTSLRPPLSALGDEAARLAMRILRGDDIPNRIVLEYRLIARTSTQSCGKLDRISPETEKMEDMK